MKSRFAFLFLLFSIISYGQQGLLLSHDFIEIGISDYIDYEELTLTNIGNETIEVAITLDPTCYIDGDDTEIQICISSSCFFGVSEQTTWGDEGVALVQLGAGESVDSIKFTPFTTAASTGSEWDLIFYDRNNPTNSTLVHVKVGDCSPVSTLDFDHEVGAAYPNPVNNKITIPYQHDAAAAQIVIYNTLGVQLTSVALSQQAGEETIDVADFNRGMYYYYILDDEGNQSRARSFVK